MEITPLLTSVENWGRRDVLWEKYFWGSLVVLIHRLRVGTWLGRTDRARNKKGLYLYMHGYRGSRDMFSGKYFWLGKACLRVDKKIMQD